MGFWKQMLRLPSAFYDFLKRTKRAALEGRRADARSPRIASISDFAADVRPLSVRQPSTARSDRASSGASEGVQRSDRSRNSSATIVETSRDVHGNMNGDFRPGETSDFTSKTSKSTDGRGREGVTVCESRENMRSNDGRNSIGSPPVGAGFKMDFDSSAVNKYETISSREYRRRGSGRSSSKENAAKFLTEWSLDAKPAAPARKESSEVDLSLTGTLLGEDRRTVLEKCYDAGVLKSRKENNLVKTSNGLYHLIGNIVGGSPNGLRQMCASQRGIPRTWKKILKEELSGVEEVAKSFSLNSSPGPIKPVTPKITTHLSMYLTRNDTAYNKNTKQSALKTLGKRKPFRPIESKSKIKQLKLDLTKINEATAKSTDQTLNRTNGNIRVTKKKRPFTKEQPSELFKTKSFTESLFSINDKLHSTESVNSTKPSKKKLVKNPNVFNNRSTRSRKNSMDNYSIASLNKLALRKNSPSSTTISKNSLNESKKSKQKGKLASVISLSGTKLINKKSTKVKKKKVSVQKKSNEQASAELGLFGGLEEAYIIDNDFKMGSPIPLSVWSCSDSNRSRSESPPAFYNLCDSESKSLTYSDPPSPIDKSVEAEALKRVKAPKVTSKEKLKYKKKVKKHCKALEKKIKLLESRKD